MSRKNDIHFKMKIYVCLRSNIVSVTVLFVQEGICERIEN